MDTVNFIRHLYKVRQQHYVNATTQCLYYELIHMCYLSGWKEQFQCSNVILADALKISNQTLTVTRDNLLEAGLIEYIPSANRMKPGYYKLLVEPTQAATQVATQAATSKSDDNNSSSSSNNSSNKEEINKEEKGQEEFARFHKAYPGVKRGIKTEYENLKKQHTDYLQVIPLLYGALQKEIAWRTTRLNLGIFTPDYPHLKTWINQKRWESEYPNESVYD